MALISVYKWDPTNKVLAPHDPAADDLSVLSLQSEGRRVPDRLWLAELLLSDPALPSAASGRGYVPGSGSEGLVEALAVPGMAVRVQLGGTGYNHQGLRLTIPTTASLAIAAADPTNPRWDLVVTTAAGALAVRQGTPGASPADPTLTAGDVLLARVVVAALDTAINAGDITDLRSRDSLNGAKLVPASVPAGVFAPAAVAPADANLTATWDFSPGVFHLPTGINCKIGAVDMPPEWTAANLETLLGGGDADALHTHGAIDPYVAFTAGAGGVAQWDVLYVSAADTVLKGDNTALASSRVVGIAAAAIAASVSGNVITRSGEVVGPYTALASIAAGSPVYLGTGGAVTATPPANPNYKAFLGLVKESDATDGTFVFQSGSEPIQM